MYEKLYNKAIKTGAELVECNVKWIYEKKEKIMVNDVTDALSDNEGVTDVSYHNEGRILNFIVTISPDLSLDSAKTYANDVTDTLSKKIKNYYDIEVFFTTEEESDIYPVIGYHHKGAKEFSWSNVGERSE